MTADSPGPDDQRLGRALDHTWAWFSLHAGQRMQLMNFYLVSVAFLLAAYANLLGLDRPALAAGVAVVGALISVAFNRLDARTRELIQIAEPVLARLQQLTGGQELPELDFVTAVAKPAKRFSSYRSVMRVVTGLSALAFTAGALYAVVIV